MMNYNEFVEKISEAIEDESFKNLKPNDFFRSHENWDSLSEMSIIAMIDHEFGITIKTIELNKLNTFEELFDYIKSK